MAVNINMNFFLRQMPSLGGPDIFCPVARLITNLRGRGGRGVGQHLLVHLGHGQHLLVHLSQLLVGQHLLVHLPQLGFDQMLALDLPLQLS